MLDRQEMIEEVLLRKTIREGIKRIKAKKYAKEILEEAFLRKTIRKLITEEEDVPHRSTGINVLEDLLKKIIPVLETDYKQLTSDKSQRDSFRAHIINATQNSLAPSKASEDAATEKALEQITESIEEEIKVHVGDEAKDEFKDPQADPEFIDIDKPESPDEELEDFAIEGEDETGRNFAARTFEKIDKQIQESYDLLANDEDRELFYDYLITNLKLYFDKFEDELQANLPEPTTQEYEQQKKEDENTDTETK